MALCQACFFLLLFFQWLQHALNQSLIHDILSVPSDSEDMVSGPGLGKARASPGDSHKVSGSIGFEATGTSARI